MVRWWDGGTWSDVMMPSGPGVAVRTAPGAAQHREVELSPADQAETGRTPRRSAVWIALVAVVVLVGAVVGTLLALRPDGDRSDRTAAPSTSAVPSQPGGGSAFPSGMVRITDRAAGISYPYLGEGWSEFDLGLQLETTETTGQYFTTQEGTPDGGIFISQCTSGPVAAEYGYAGPSTLQSTVTRLAASVRGNYYPGPNEREVLRDEARTVDGRAAHLVEFTLTWDVEGYDATGERAALLLIDVGRPAPALVYISIPNTHAELYGVIDRVLEDIDVL
ncbi:hypothetical protein BKA19_2670 [Blastococcus saxobsidens]|uniref:DUF2510 domain-containing protein n=2 Tax=Blastococcus saxobsidens TaxID=138336 RepID=A0A4Q7YA53_9ACTN|nr:hypothetical protein BKA19_2670 [Blastococcus saxobsidens]